MPNYFVSLFQRLDKARLRLSFLSLGGVIFGFALFCMTKNPLFDDVNIPGAEWVAICRFFSLTTVFAYIFAATPWVYKQEEHNYDPLTITMKGAKYSLGAMFALPIATIPLAMMFGPPLPVELRPVFLVVNAVIILAAGGAGAYRGALVLPTSNAMGVARVLRFIVTASILMFPFILIKLFGVSIFS
jgi:hypothetical protein